jgi:type IV secretory pathway VirD2 relaxase
MMSEDTHGIKLKVRTHKGLTKTHPGMKKAMNALWAVVKASSSSRRKSQQRQVRATVPKQVQRAAVRVTYVGPKTKGLWKAHGTYLQRESATGKEQAGFNAGSVGVPVAETLEAWQKADDPRLFKIILSPEFGEGIDMERYTRDVMAKIQKDVNAPLEWVAVSHYNTDHPHVHVALRAVTLDNRDLQFPKDYIRTTIRDHAQQAATQQLGYRAQRDIDKARQREITLPSLTALDRNIARKMPTGNLAPTFDVTFNARATKALRSDRRADVVAMGARLRNLETMGLATMVAPDRWTVQSNFTVVLKTAQMAGDRQRTFARQMAKASDMNLPFVSDNWNAVDGLKGRVLGHGEEEARGKHFMLVEGVDGKIHYLTHRKETEELRANQQLKANEFITFSKVRGRLKIEQLGSADKILTDAKFLASQAIPIPTENPRPGWLGAYDQAIMLHHLAKEPIEMPNVIDTSNTKLHLTLAQLKDYMEKTGAQPKYVQTIVNKVEQEQKFHMDVSGGTISHNRVEMGGEEGMALYASLSPDAREILMDKLAITDDAQLTQQEEWIKERAQLRDLADKARELEEAKAVAREAYPDQELQAVEADEFGGSYKGEVVGITDNYVVTKEGEDLVVHSKQQLERVPDLGKRVDIQYTTPQQKANVTTLGKRIQKELEL